MPRPEPSADLSLHLVAGEEPLLSPADIYRRYCRYVGAVILRLDGRPADLDDLIQDVFVEATAGLSRLRDPEAIRGWLATIAVRTVRRRLRMRRLTRLFHESAEPVEGIDAAASPQDRLLLRAVYRVLDEMPTDDRIAFCLHRLEGETIEAVARLCACSIATVKRRVARAQKRVEERVGDV